MKKLTVSTACMLVALALFLLASVGLWPDDWRDDIEPVSLGLAFFVASWLAP